MVPLPMSPTPSPLLSFILPIVSLPSSCLTRDRNSYPDTEMGRCAALPSCKLPFRGR